MSNKGIFIQSVSSFLFSFSSQTSKHTQTTPTNGTHCIQEQWKFYMQCCPSVVVYVCVCILVNMELFWSNIISLGK